MDLDPLDSISFEVLGMSYYYAGQEADARRIFERVRVFSPNFRGLSGNAGFSYLPDGQPAAARRECESHPDDDTARACLAAAEHGLGMTSAPAPFLRTSSKSILGVPAMSSPRRTRFPDTLRLLSSD